jgi:predicted acetyltransferase
MHHLNLLEIEQSMNIISKFTLGSEKGIDIFLSLKEAHLNEMYKGLVDPIRLKSYIGTELDRRTAINNLNDLSTQLIVVFDIDDDRALGYAIIRNNFHQPSILQGKRAVNLSFFILPEYNIQKVQQSLWQKCFSITKNYSHCIELPADNPLISFFESLEFKVAEESKLQPFDITSQIMVRVN